MNTLHTSSVRRTVECTPAARTGYRGFSLLEVLIALLVLSIGLLGLAGLQANAVSFNHSAYMRTQATNLAYEIADRMRANRQAALDGDYNEAFAVAPPACDDDVEDGTVAKEDLAAWRIALSCALPGGNGSVNLDGDRLTIVIRWDETRGDGDDDDREVFSMVTGL